MDRGSPEEWTRDRVNNTSCRSWDELQGAVVTGSTGRRRLLNLRAAWECYYRAASMYAAIDRPSSTDSHRIEPRSDQQGTTQADAD
jgi:hypothetical protein